MRKILCFFAMFHIILLYSQTVNIFLNLSNNRDICIKVKSKIKLVLKNELRYANNSMYQVETLGIDKNQLTLFVYDTQDSLVESLVAFKPKGKLDITLEEYSEIEKKVEKEKQNARNIILPNKLKEINFDFKVFDSAEEVFKMYPCKLFDCWQDFYELKKGMKYKVQIQLKIKGKIYKSNTVEFIY